MGFFLPLLEADSEETTDTTSTETTEETSTEEEQPEETENEETTEEVPEDNTGDLPDEPPAEENPTSEEGETPAEEEIENPHLRLRILEDFESLLSLSDKLKEVISSSEFPPGETLSFLNTEVSKIDKQISIIMLGAVKSLSVEKLQSISSIIETKLKLSISLADKLMNKKL